MFAEHDCMLWRCSVLMDVWTVEWAWMWRSPPTDNITVGSFEMLLLCGLSASKKYDTINAFNQTLTCHFQVKSVLYTAQSHKYSTWYSLSFPTLVSDEEKVLRVESKTMLWTASHFCSSLNISLPLVKLHCWNKCSGPSETSFANRQKCTVSHTDIWKAHQRQNVLKVSQKQVQIKT